MKYIFQALLIILLLFSHLSNAQCDTCTSIGPTSGNFTALSNTTTCFTSNANLSTVTLQNNSSICIAPGVTVNVSNNVNTTSSTSANIDIHGSLILFQSLDFNSNLIVNIGSNGLFRVGSTNNPGNIGLNGNGINYFINEGTISLGVISFLNSY